MIRRNGIIATAHGLPGRGMVADLVIRRHIVVLGLRAGADSGG